MIRNKALWAVFHHSLSFNWGKRSKNLLERSTSQICSTTFSLLMFEQSSWPFEQRLSIFWSFILQLDLRSLFLFYMGHMTLDDFSWTYQSIFNIQYWIYSGTDPVKYKNHFFQIFIIINMQTHIVIKIIRNYSKKKCSDYPGLWCRRHFYLQNFTKFQISSI